MKISDAFLNQGEIVSTRSRRADEGQRFNAKPGDITEGLPIVIPVNGGPRLNEIVAVRQDHRRAMFSAPGRSARGRSRHYSAVRSWCDPTDHREVLHPSGRSIQARVSIQISSSSKPSWKIHNPSGGAKKTYAAVWIIRVVATTAVPAESPKRARGWMIISFPARSICCAASHFTAPAPATKRFFVADGVTTASIRQPGSRDEKRRKIAFTPAAQLRYRGRGCVNLVVERSGDPPLAVAVPAERKHRKNKLDSNTAAEKPQPLASKIEPPPAAGAPEGTRTEPRKKSAPRRRIRHRQRPRNRRPRGEKDPTALSATTPPPDKLEPGELAKDGTENCAEIDRQTPGETRSANRIEGVTARSFGRPHRRCPTPGWCR